MKGKEVLFMDVSGPLVAVHLHSSDRKLFIWIDIVSLT